MQDHRGGVDTDDAIAFCTRVQPRLLGALTMQCRDAAVAEELTQETLAVIWDKWSRVQRMRSPEAWAMRIGFNMANSWIRRRVAERRALSRSHLVPVIGELPDRLDVREAVGRLPRRQRAAVVLRYYADLSIADTATAMGCATGTVKALTHQGLAALRAELSAPAEELQNGR